MTDPTTDAAREARGTLRARVDHEYECESQTFVQGPCNCNRDALLDTYAAAVSRARDAAWRAAVEAVREDECPRIGGHLRSHCGCLTGAVDGVDGSARKRLAGGNAALDALLARMDGAK